MNLSVKQQEFLDLVSSGRNVFLTGKAGTGKSFVLKEAMKVLTEQNKKFVAIAPTGIAASNIEGQTIHSMFGLTPFGVWDFETCNFLRGEKRKLLQAIQVIFVDEISMLRPDILDAMNWTMIKNGCEPLTSKQIIFTGDLKQLPAILDDNTRSVLYRTYDGEVFTDAKIYEKMEVVTIELDVVQRQSDPEFIDNLNIIREGGRSPYFRQFVSNAPNGIVLAPHNATVDRYNQAGLAALSGEEYVFEAKITGNVKADDFNFESTVRVKNGAKVMYLFNSRNNNLVNGTLGIFVSHSDCHYIRVGEVDYALEQVLCVKKEYVLNKAEDKLELVEIGSIYQYPIKLAYALSIHKSQGLTFEEVTVDLSKPCFQKGQMYVALSRVTSPKGLRIITG